MDTPSNGDQFSFDFVAGESTTQEAIFARIGKPVVDTCLQGYNSTVFAYGQTGSGKTHTIQGLKQTEKSDERGILPRQFEYLFSEVKKIKTLHKMAREKRASGGRVTPSQQRQKGFGNIGDDVEEVIFEVVCAYSEIFDLLDASQTKKLQIKEHP
jgi:hypothetical protein